MDEEKKIEATTPKTRRAFVKTAGQVAMTAPAVMLLLDASTKKAAAQVPYGVLPFGDDVDEGFDGPN